MTQNEINIIYGMADRLEEGGPVRGSFGLLHTETQQAIYAIAPNLMMPNLSRAERLAMADALRGLIGAEVDA